MARPIAVVLQEFATLGANVVTTPTQGVCLLGKCIVEADPTLPGYDGGVMTVPYADLDTDNFSPFNAKAGMVITSAKMWLVDAVLDIAAGTASGSSGTTNQITFVSNPHIEVGDLFAADGPVTGRVMSVSSNGLTIGLSKDVAYNADVTFTRVVSAYIDQDDADLIASDDSSKIRRPSVPQIGGFDVLSATEGWVEYKARREDMSDTVLKVSAGDFQDLDKLGPATVNNPLSLAAKIAFDNAGSQYIYCVGVNNGGADSTDFTATLDGLFQYKDIYAIVPICESSVVASAVATSLRASLATQADATTALSSGVAQRFRIAVVGGFSVDTSTTRVADKAAKVVSESGNDVTLLASSAAFLTAGVVSNDTITVSYDGDTFTGVVKSVINEQRLVVTSAAFAAAVVANNDVTIDTIVSSTGYEDKTLAAIALNGVDSRRVYLAWQPIQITLSGVAYDVGSQYLAAAVGGLIASLPPHAAITNITVGGIDKIRNNRYSESQLTRISNAGLLVFKQDSATSAPYCIHGVSTAKSGGVQFSELSLVKTYDYVAAYFQARQEAFLSGWNINEQTIGFIKADLEIGIDELRSKNYAKLGTVILAAEIVSVSQNAAVTDKVDSEILVTFPRPLNTLALRLVSQ